MGKLDDSAFLATVVHELRAPLNACLMSLNLLELKASQTAEVLRCTEVIKRNLERQARLIGDLADMAQMATDGIEVLPEPVEAAELLESAIESARPAAAERSVGIEPIDSQGSHLLQADPDRLTRALGTLIEYIAAGGPPGSRITLQLAASGDALELQCSRRDPDEDAGEPSSAGVKLSEPKGFVVRLAIVEEVLDAHGGRFDRGAARWTVRLPLLRATQQRQP